MPASARAPPQFGHWNRGEPSGGTVGGGGAPLPPGNADPLRRGTGVRIDVDRPALALAQLAAQLTAAFALVPLFAVAPGPLGLSEFGFGVLLTAAAALCAVAAVAVAADGGEESAEPAGAFRSMRPPIRWHPIPYSAERRSDMAAYAKRHYGMRTSQLREPRVIDERVDYQLVGHIARERPDWSVAMVGPVVKIGEGDLPRRPNRARLRCTW